MCGIIAAFSTEYKKSEVKVKPEDVNDFIINQFEDQHSRGTEGFGIIRINGKKEIEIDRACESAKFLIDLYMKKSKMIIAHHRKPTSTENKLDQTHPIWVSDKFLKKDYLVIHNGIIYNDKELKKKHEELGFQYNTEYRIYSSYQTETTTEKFNDSEALAIEMALFIEKQIKEVRTDNNAAFIILEMDKESEKAEKIYFGRNGTSSDLNMSKTRGSLKLSSEGKGDPIKENILYSFNIKDKEMKLTKQAMPFVKEVVTPIITKTETEKGMRKKVQWEDFPDSRLTQNSSSKKETEEDDDTNSLPYRDWVIDPDDEEKIEAKRSTFPFNKNRSTDICRDLVIATHKMNTEEILLEIEGLLEDEIEYINEIITDFKESLMVDRLDKRAIGRFIMKVATIMRTMGTATDLAESTYKEVGLNEEISQYKKDGENLYPTEEYDGDHIDENGSFQTNLYKTNNCGFRSY